MPTHKQQIAAQLGLPGGRGYENATAEVVPAGGRVTATRLALLGPFALAAKKGQSLIIVTTHDGEQIVCKGNYKMREAYELAAKFNAA